MKMRRTLTFGLAAAGVTLAGIIGVVTATAGANGPADGGLAQVRSATSSYRKIERAIDAGYVQFFGCVHEPLAGGMGVHFVNGPLVADAVIDPAKPEALMYQARDDGRYDLLGAEYVVFKADWDKTHQTPPTLFGEEFHTVAEPNRYGIGAFYELHAWAWRPNPTGGHQDWNPAVLCPGTEGHTH